MKTLFAAAFLTLFVPLTAFAQSRAIFDDAAPILITQTEPVAEPTAAPAPSAEGGSASGGEPAPRPVPISAPAPTPEPTLYESAPTAEDVQEFVEAVSDTAPRAVQPYLKFIASAIGGALVFFGLQKAAQKINQSGTTECAHCQGTGREAKGACANCHGTRQVEEEYEPKVKCAHCDGEGKEPCESCKGKGCVACRERGQERDDENKTIDCNVCGGEGEIEAKLKRNVPCPDCH